MILICHLQSGGSCDRLMSIVRLVSRIYTFTVHLCICGTVYSGAHSPLLGVLYAQYRQLPLLCLHSPFHFYSYESNVVLS